MIGFAAKRIAATAPVLVLVAVFVFLLLRLAPGDPAAIIAGEQATPEQILAIRQKLGLDAPLLSQFASWIGQLALGDLGQSIFSGLPVSELIAQRLQPTLMLAMATIIFAVLIAIPLGVIAAKRAGSLIDRMTMAGAVLGFSTPVFVIAFLLVYIFALSFRLFPTQGYVPLEQGVLASLHSLVLPALALSWTYIALIARVTRAAVLDVLQEDYVRTAHAKGLSEARIMSRHVLKNAAAPVITVIGIGLAALLGGVVVTETVFSIPGLGRLTADAILRRDYPVVQALILLFSVVYVLANLIVDLSYGLVDPRVRA
ncbi:MAG: peptide ABC transporter [Rhizobiales bacterium 65-9]|nr:ABC transporter permease [Hyphomicrobiales bacterium]OJY36691.1 MAG: peptide ABC transporter [Rhizobiales bacterium 65-9]